MGGETGERLGQGMTDLFYFYDSSISFPYSFLISTCAYIRLDDLVVSITRFWTESVSKFKLIISKTIMNLD
jgi:hypothetical protein